MVLAGYFFLTLAVLLVSLGTWLAPCLAVIARKFTSLKHKNPAPHSTAQQSFSLDVLIPAHNEKDSLPKSIQFLKSLAQDQKACVQSLKVIVGLSNWNTYDAVQASQGADEVIEINEGSKWTALYKLIQAARADWVALIDSGVIWSPTTLAELSKHNQDGTVMAFNPTYTEQNPGVVQRLIWGLERNLKRIENFAGGPISLHGACIFYRRKELLEVMNYLQNSRQNNQEWFNDDVVIPLIMREKFPQNQIVYSNICSSLDLLPSFNTNELSRRRRMLLGNIQWVSMFLGHLTRGSLQLFFLAVRRIARMMWAWWFILAALGVGLIIPWLLPAGILFLISLSFFSAGKRILEAARVSIFFPVYFYRYQKNQAELIWK